MKRTRWAWCYGGAVALVASGIGALFLPLAQQPVAYTLVLAVAVVWLLGCGIALRSIR